MVRLWNRIQSMENDRLPKIIMDWDRKLALEGRENWNWHFREIMADCDHTEVFDLELCLGVSFVKRIQDIIRTDNASLTDSGGQTLLHYCSLQKSYSTRPSQRLF